VASKIEKAMFGAFACSPPRRSCSSSQRPLNRSVTPAAPPCRGCPRP
jgi:hypothetical protein